MPIMGVYRCVGIFMEALIFKCLNIKLYLHCGESLKYTEEEILSILSVNFLGIFVSMGSAASPTGAARSKNHSE